VGSLSLVPCSAWYVELPACGSTLSAQTAQTFRSLPRPSRFALRASPPSFLPSSPFAHLSAHNVRRVLRPPRSLCDIPRFVVPPPVPRVLPHSCGLPPRVHRLPVAREREQPVVGEAQGLGEELYEQVEEARVRGGHGGRVGGRLP
jgi:hypothetical protein